MSITRLRTMARKWGAVGTLIAGAWLAWQASKTWRGRFILLLILLIGLCWLLTPVYCPLRLRSERADGMLRNAGSGSLQAVLGAHTAKEPLRVTFLDVGKGDAFVLETPGGKCLLVDAGGTLPRGDDRGRTVVAPFLRARKRKRIDLLLLTHPHPDHVGGAATLIAQFPVANLVDNGLDSPVKAYKQYRDAAQKRKVRCSVAARGWCYDCGDGVVLRAVGPLKTTQAHGYDWNSTNTHTANADAAAGKSPIQPRREEYDPNGNKEVNNSSIVLRVDYGKTSLLLTGDAEGEAEDEMMQSRQPLACDVLKVGHHGSNKSTSARFLQAVRPRWAVISVNADNRSHPAPQVLERLRQAGAEIFRTDEHGNVTCLSDGRALRFETARRPAMIQPR